MESNTKKTKTYKVIGDIHGRTNWYDLVKDIDEDTIVIFVGDYTDPYAKEGIYFEQMFQQLMEIVTFKKEHPNNVVLLYGNHDFQYVVGYKNTNRYDKWHAAQLYRFFQENEEWFDGVAYQIDDKYLITHAGVVRQWYENYFGPYDPTTPLATVVKKINGLWELDKFAFDMNPSPIWVRPYPLLENNLFGTEKCDRIQVVGHTALDMGKVATIGLLPHPDPESEFKWRSVINNPDSTSKVVMVDCLAYSTDCFTVKVETSQDDAEDTNLS